LSEKISEVSEHEIRRFRRRIGYMKRKEILGRYVKVE